METGQWLKVSSNRLKKLGIEPVTGLIDRRFIYYIMASSILGFKEDITIIKRSAYNALNVSNTQVLYIIPVCPHLPDSSSKQTPFSHSWTSKFSPRHVI